MDPVSRKAFRTPMFIAGVVMLIVGLVPVVVGLISGWDRIANLSLLSVFAPVGAVLMALGRSKAADEWRRGR